MEAAMFDGGGHIDGRSSGSIAESVRATFESIQAQAQTRWYKQHDASGGHTDVTALSISTPRLRLRMAGDPATTRGAAPRYKPATPDGAIFVRDATSGSDWTNGVPLDVAPHTMFVSIRANGGGPFLLYGIRQPGVRYGDVLFIRKDPRSASNIEIQDRVVASVPVGTEIHVPADQTASYPDFYLTTSGAWLPLVYSPGVGTNRADGWAMLYTFSA
jgi:hypothetical protein